MRYASTFFPFQWNRSFIVMLFMSLIFLMGCGSQKKGNSDPQNFEELRDLVNNREFSIEFQWAQPQGGSQVDLLSNPNHIKFKGEEVDIFLPFFGERHRGGGYGNNTGGILYKGNMSNLVIRENSSKQQILLRFEGRQETEMLVFNITLFDNGKAQANVSSSDRSNITYQGGVIKPTSRARE